MTFPGWCPASAIPDVNGRRPEGSGIPSPGPLRKLLAEQQGRSWTLIHRTQLTARSIAVTGHEDQQDNLHKSGPAKTAVAQWIEHGPKD